MEVFKVEPTSQREQLGPEKRVRRATRPRRPAIVYVRVKFELCRAPPKLRLYSHLRREHNMHVPCLNVVQTQKNLPPEIILYKVEISPVTIPFPYIGIIASSTIIKVKYIVKAKEAAVVIARIVMGFLINIINAMST